MTSRIRPHPTTIFEVSSRPAERSSVFAPEDSALHGQMIFIVGAPRSGTTWLQQLLAVHPDIATTGESHLFCEGLQAIFDNHAEPDDTMMLSTWVNESELSTLCRRFADGVFATMRDGVRPEAGRILDKTPNHRQQSALQARLYPDAAYVHIIRDGRDSAGSSHSMWKRFSTEYGSADRAASIWADAVRDVRTHLRDLRYLEVRYEDLLDDVEGGLATILDHLDLDHDPGFLRSAAEFGKAPINVSPTSVAIGARKRAGDPVVDRAVARVAGDLLADLGYASPTEVERAASTRTVATVKVDAAAAVERGFRAAPDVATRLVSKYRRLRWQRQTRAVRSLSSALVSGIAADDRGAIHSLLRDAAGSPTPEEIAEVLEGHRCVSTKVEQHRAALTFVSDLGTRRLVRLAERQGRVTELEVI